MIAENNSKHQVDRQGRRWLHLPATSTQNQSAVPPGPVEPSWARMTSGSSGGVEYGVTSKSSNWSSKENKKGCSKGHKEGAVWVKFRLADSKGGEVKGGVGHK